MKFFMTQNVISFFLHEFMKDKELKLPGESYFDVFRFN